jgi:excisionase family DNA binding protein
MDNPTLLLRIGEASQITGLSRDYLRMLCVCGDVKAIRTKGGQWRIIRRSLLIHLNIIKDPNERNRR